MSFDFCLLSFVFCILSFFHQDHHCGSESSSPRIVSGAEAGLHDALPVTKHVKLRQRHVWRHLNTAQVLSTVFFSSHFHVKLRQPHLNTSQRSISFIHFCLFFFKSHIFHSKKHNLKFTALDKLLLKSFFSFCL